jgi:starch-binding outer membrane protein, SusD/RagB family
MKKYSIIFAITALSAVSLFSSCSKALDVAPTESIEASLALTTKEGINAALIGAYARLKSPRLYGRDLIAIPEVLADNGWATNRSGRLFAEANNAVRAHFLGDTWQLSYRSINELNLILESLASTTVLTAAERNSIEGQALFLRALNHLNLALVYAYIPGAEVSGQDRGGIPILLTGTNTTGGALGLKPGRAPIAEVYTQIVADFERANSLLTAGGVAPFSVFPNFATKRSAQAFLSRVNLYRKNYTDAKRWSDSTIALSGTRLTSGAAYISGWRAATHPETLFQVAFLGTNENIGVNESLQTTHTTLGSPGATGTTVGWGDVIPSLTLLNDLGITLVGGNTSNNFRNNAHAIESKSADIRNQLYEVGAAGRGPVKVEVTKYLGKNGAPNLDNAPVIRIAEAYLNRAEAMATPGSAVFNETAALADLNTIKVARGLTAVTLTGNALYEEILKERRVELAFEGHRFWDFKRLGRDIIKAPVYNGGDVLFADFRILAPIPIREVEVNPNLVQNAGY